MRLGFWRAAMGALQILGWFGLIEIRWVGEQVMIGDAPVDPFFIEAASVGLIAFAALALVGLFWERISQWRGVDDISAWTAVRLTSKRTKNAAQGRVFKEMSHEIRAARDRFVKLSEEVKLGFSMHHLRVNADIVDIGIKLSSIDLSVPSKVDLTDPKGRTHLVARILDLSYPSC